MFDLCGWDTEPDRSLGLIFGDQRARDIVLTILRPLASRFVGSSTFGSAPPI
jgi:hypothetical protein